MNYAEGLHFSAFHFLGTGQVSPVCPLCTSTGRNGGYKHTAQLNTNVSIRATEAVDPRWPRWHPDMNHIQYGAGILHTEIEPR